MLTRTEGIVLKTQKYGEADLIVTYITPDRGIISAFAKSPRKTKSRFGSSLEPLTHAKISLWGKEQSLPKLTQSDIIHSFQKIREDYNDFIHVSKLSEILLSLTPSDSPNKKLFSFFLNILQFISSSEQESKEPLHLISRIRLLAVIGYAPRMSGCGRCGNNSIDFFPDAGTTLCRKCSRPSAGASKPFIRLNNQIIQFYKHSIEWPVNRSNRLKPHEDTLTALSAVLDRHLQYILARNLRSSEFHANTGK
ncbi:MAG: DNA repair protein RecO [Nitrospiraceae bacterium]|nr:MAG: DNA repair protein RecO [Nitrospiraceae bacterium]